MKDLPLALPRRQMMLYLIPGKNILTQWADPACKSGEWNSRAEIMCFPPFWGVCYPQKSEWGTRSLVLHEARY